MKITKFLLLVCFLLLFTLFGALESLAALSDGFAPTPPPRTPVTDYMNKSTKVIDFNYLRYSDDGIDFNGYGAGFNYVNPFGASGLNAYNIGIGAMYLSGETDNGVSADGGIVPLNGNFAYRAYGDADGSNVILIGGLHVSYIYAYIDTSNGIEMSSWGWGPLLGIKGTYAVNQIKIIPFYFFQLSFTYTDIWVGDYYYYNEDTIALHIIGFDIEFSNFSLGAMFDLINSGSGDLISLNASVAF